MGLIDRWAKAASLAPSLANALARTSAAKWAAGIDHRANVPPFAKQTFRARFRSGPSRTGERVLLWPDTFNNHFRPETLLAATELLELGGFEVAIPEKQLCCGRPLYDWGFLDRAKRYLERILHALGKDIAAGTPIVVLEPACASVFKDELLNLLPERDDARRLSKQVLFISDFIAARLDRFRELWTGGSALVQPHCHHHAIIGFDEEQRLLDAMKIAVERPRQGCCGMAGAFGMARESFDTGKAIGERVLLPRVRELDANALILANGFSCREQIELHGGRKTTHIAELLRDRAVRRR